MASFNKVILMGNLTRDPELRFTPSNMAICKVGLAVNRRFKDSTSGEWREEPTFIDVTIFGKRGEAFQKFHQKGASAFFEGSLRLDQWEDKNGGGKRSKLYVVADTWEFVGGRSERGGGGGGDFGGSYSEQGASSGGGSGGGYGGGGGSGGGGGGYGQEGGREGGYGGGGGGGYAPAEPAPQRGGQGGYDAGRAEPSPDSTSGDAPGGGPGFLDPDEDTPF